MEYTAYNPLLATQLKIRKAFEDMRSGRSSKRPFAVGGIEKRMKDWAQANGIQLASQSLYMSEYSIQHSVRDSKRRDGIAVTQQELEEFPLRRYGMDLYYDMDEKNFNYVDTELRAKYIIEPQYEVKFFRGKKTKLVAHITAQRLDDNEVFTDEIRYKKIR